VGVIFLSGHFVGRSAERALFADALARTDPVAIFVHGAGGSGKSALLAAFAEGPPRIVAVGPDLVLPPLGPGRAVILIDDCDDITGLATSLRRRWNAELPADGVVVVASRTQIPANLRLAPGWPARVELIELGALNIAEVEECLATTDFDAPVRERIARLSLGNPLALRLLTDVAANAPDQLPVEALEENMTLVRQLIDGIVEPVPTATHRSAVQLAAQVGHTTEDLLSAALDGDAHDLFEWLRREPYISEADEGLVPDPLVRQLVDADLRWRDRLSYATLHRRASRHLINRIDAQSHGLESVLRNGDELLALVRHRVAAPTGPVGPIDRAVYLADKLSSAPLGEVITEHVRQSGAPREAEQVAVTVIEHLAALPTAMGTAAFEAHHSGTLGWDFVVVPHGAVEPGLIALFDLHHVASLEAQGLELFAHDWRRLSPSGWLRKIADQPWDAPIPAPTGVERRVLTDESEFTSAVRSALRDLKSERRLAANPLVDSRMVQEALADLTPEQRLRELIDNAAETLRTTDAALFRIVDRVYLRPSASQQNVAESMGLPFTTFRRWRNRAVGLIAAQLWQRELGIERR